MNVLRRWLNYMIARFRKEDKQLQPPLKPTMDQQLIRTERKEILVMRTEEEQNTGVVEEQQQQQNGEEDQGTAAADAENQGGYDTVDDGVAQSDDTTGAPTQEDVDAQKRRADFAEAKAREITAIVDQLEAQSGQAKVKPVEEETEEAPVAVVELNGSQSFKAVNVLIAEGEAVESQIAVLEQEVRDEELRLSQLRETNNAKIVALRAQLADIPSRAGKHFERISLRKQELSTRIADWA